MIGFSAGKKLFPIVAVLLAVDYFLFQVEPFEEEYLEHHRPPSDRPAVAGPSVTWETFDKSNAPTAFTVEACAAVVLLGVIRQIEVTLDPCPSPVHPVRDKSPPAPSA